MFKPSGVPGAVGGIARRFPATVTTGGIVPGAFGTPVAPCEAGASPGNGPNRNTPDLLFAFGSHRVGVVVMPLLFVGGRAPTCCCCCCCCGVVGTCEDSVGAAVPEPFWLPANAVPSRVVLPPITGCGCVDPATPVVMLPPAVAGDVVVCCVLVEVTILTVVACDVWDAVAGGVTVAALSVISKDDAAVLRLLAGAAVAGLVVVDVVVVL